MKAPAPSKKIENKADGRELRVRIVVALGITFIAGCVAVLLWVLGVFSH